MRLVVSALGRGTLSTCCDIHVFQLETVKPPERLARSPPVLLCSGVRPVTLAAITPATPWITVAISSAETPWPKARLAKLNSVISVRHIAACTVGWS